MSESNQREPASHPELVLVTGATGNVGRHVVSGLLASGIRVRALSRDPGKAGLPAEVDVVRGDFTAPDTLDAALDGVDSVFLVWRSLEAKGAAAVIDKIRQYARRVVLLSSSAVQDGVAQQPNVVGQVHADIEQLIEKSGLGWTFLRPGGFAANSLWWWAPLIRVGDVVRWPYATASQPPIHERDIADVAVRALTESGHDGAKYILTGPRTLTPRAQVETIGEVIGRPLRFEEIPPETARTQMLTVMPAPIVDLLLGTLGRLIEQPAPANTTVEDVTGTAARTYREWVVDHASDFQLTSEKSAALAGAATTR
jgi:uncharacterized protein YbjT (DUF2867 family)